MQKLNLPSFEFKIIKRDDKHFIFDIIRKKYVVLTPEEWVRQHLVHYLIEQKGFPASLISVELSLKINRVKLRADIALHNNKQEVLMVVECKAPEVAINKSVFEQVVRYNIQFRAPYLLVSNGLKHFCTHINLNDLSHQFIQEIPNYKDISTCN